MKIMGPAFYADLAIFILYIEHVESNVKTKRNSHSGSIIFISARRKCFLPGVFTNNLEIYKEQRKKNKHTSESYFKFSFLSSITPMPACMFQAKKAED